jgi:O-antigen/teichoic acid export membrane protein
VRKYYDQIRSLLFSATAKDTLVLFSGNLLAAFWGFVFILIVARALSVYDFGVFSAVLNLVVILASIADIGISTGSINFISSHLAKGEEEKADEYTKASFIVRIIIVLSVSVVVAIFAPFVSKTFLATRDPAMALWAAAIPIFIFPDAFFPFVLQARKKFFHSTLIDNVFYLVRLLFALAFYLVGGLTMSKAFWAFGAGFLIEGILILIFVKTKFMHSKPKKDEYKNLLKFSGWMGVSRVTSSVSGRLDIQMLASMVGALATGLYSIPSRLASFISVLSGSFSSVLATRLAGFGDKENEKKYILKSLLAIVPIVIGVVFLIIMAKPFILILFGEKYLASVPIFQALAAVQIPFLLATPSTSAIIYSMKKTVYIGIFSSFQLIAILILNFILIPKFGVYGPVISIGVANVILVILSWWLVIKHYWVKK